MTGHHCARARQRVLSHRQALRMARWWTQAGRPTVAGPCPACGGWHTRIVPTLTLGGARP